MNKKELDDKIAQVAEKSRNQMRVKIVSKGETESVWALEGDIPNTAIINNLLLSDVVQYKDLVEYDNNKVVKRVIKPSGYTGYCVNYQPVTKEAFRKLTEDCQAAGITVAGQMPGMASVALPPGMGVEVLEKALRGNIE